MDSLTQATLGAAVGEAYLGKKAGWKGAAAGAVFGTIPDLDVVFRFAYDAVGQLQIHRGLSHSFFFSVAAAPILGYIISKISKKDQVTWKQWSILAFLAFFTHIILDLFTTYGTQILQPFSNYSATFSSIFIIDPLYTAPLLLFLIAALMMRRDDRRRRIVNWVGLTVSTVYLAATFGVKLHADSVFRASLEKQDIQYTQMLSTPTLFNSMLWTVYADDGKHVWVGLYSIFDDDKDVKFNPVPKNAHLLEGHENDRAVETLLWFSHGYFTVEEADDGYLYFKDMRMGRMDSYLGESNSYTFTFRLINSEDKGYYVFDRKPYDLNREEFSFEKFVGRLFGNEEVMQSASITPTAYN